MFVGDTYPTLDEKFRLVLPAKYRKDLGTVFYALIDFDHCISLYPEKEYLERAEKITKLDQFSADARKLKRLFFGNSLEVTVDKVGRILLPKSFLDKAHVEREVALIGVFDHLELWNRATYSQKNAEEDADYETLAERLANKD